MKDLLRWTSIEDDLPASGEYYVLLCMEPTDEILKIDFGILLTNEEGEQGWFIGNEVKVISVPSRKYWTYVEEIDLSIPEFKNGDFPSSLVDHFIKKLQLFDKKFQIIAAKMINAGKGLYPLDYFISGILNRSSSLIYGFETLIRSSNYISAAHLIRPHLDNYLRLSAAWMVNKPHDFASAVWKGEEIRKIRDSQGNLMTDNYLKKKAVEEYPWMKDVYEETCGFIHFSYKHIRNATTLSKKEEEHSLITFIGKIDNNVSNKNRLEAIICMIEISNCITKLIAGWIETKRIKG